MAALVVAVSVASVGCGSATKTASPSSPSGAALNSATGRPRLDGPNKTINDYIDENNITETPFKPDDPGTPRFDFPFPPDWSNAGDRTPEWAYGAIVYDKPLDPADPPAMVAIASKLTGSVDPAKILEYAPGQLLNLPGFKPLGDPEKSTLGGFEAVQSAGTYTYDGKARVIAQKTVVIPGNDSLFALQLNADAPQTQEAVVIDAAKIIDEQTKIAAPQR
ncbi:MAG: LpqN/LpqT family lipoprotein [Mycobacterium sp.]